jgi:uncharacterized protein
MTNKIAINFISFYQIVLSTILKNILGVNRFCRFEETCSAYAKRAINEKGVIEGLILGFVRILKCQPLYRGS